MPFCNCKAIADISCSLCGDPPSDEVGLSLKKMPCGHFIHQECFNSLKGGAANVRVCASCNKSLGNLSWETLEPVETESRTKATGYCANCKEYTCTNCQKDHLKHPEHHKTFPEWYEYFTNGIASKLYESQKDIAKNQAQAKISYEQNEKNLKGFYELKVQLDNLLAAAEDRKQKLDDYFKQVEQAEETRVANEKISNDLKAKYPDEASFTENIEEITSTLKEISTINVAPAPEFDALPMFSGSSGSGQFLCGVEEPAPIAGLKQVPKNCISWSKKKGYDRAMFVVTLDGNQVYYGSYKPCIEIKNAVPGKDNIIAVKATFDNINFTKEQELNFNVLYTPTPDVDLRPGRLVITFKDDPNNKGYYEKNNTGIKGFNAAQWKSLIVDNSPLTISTPTAISYTFRYSVVSKNGTESNEGTLDLTSCAPISKPILGKFVESARSISNAEDLLRQKGISCTSGKPLKKDYSAALLPKGNLFITKPGEQPFIEYTFENNVTVEMYSFESQQVHAPSVWALTAQDIDGVTHILDYSMYQR